MQGTREQARNSFTQEDVNQGSVIYHQQATGSTSDSVLLEATNGVTKVGPIRLEIDIIPILLPLQVQNVHYVPMLDDIKKGKNFIKGEKFIFPAKGLHKGGID